MPSAWLAVESLILGDPARLDRDAVVVRKKLILRIEAEIDRVIGARSCGPSGIERCCKTERPDLQRAPSPSWLHRKPPVGCQSFDGRAVRHRAEGRVGPLAQ